MRGTGCGGTGDNTLMVLPALQLRKHRGELEPGPAHDGLRVILTAESLDLCPAARILQGACADRSELLAVGIMPSVVERNSTPSIRSSSISTTRCSTPRPSRSSFHTASVSPRRNCSNSQSRAGRLVILPDMQVSNTSSHPALQNTSSWRVRFWSSAGACWGVLGLNTSAHSFPSKNVPVRLENRAYQEGNSFPDNSACVRRHLLGRPGSAVRTT